MTRKSTSKQKVGQPSKYERLNIADKLSAIAGWVMHGSTAQDIADLLGISRFTVFRWQGQYPEFAKVIEKGRMIANGELLNSAFRKATGYDYYEDVLAKDGKTVFHLKKHAPSDTGMLCFMLKNKFSPDNKNLADGVERFVDRQEIAGKNGKPIELLVKWDGNRNETPIAGQASSTPAAAN